MRELKRCPGSCLLVGGGGGELRHPAAAITQLWSNDRQGLADSRLGVVYSVLPLRTLENIALSLNFYITTSPHHFDSLSKWLFIYPH